MGTPDYAQIAKESRLKVLELVRKAGTSHIGSLFSSADIMAVLFELFDFDRDIFVAGKSWIAALLYYHLWRKRRITEKELNSFCQQIQCQECHGNKYITVGPEIGSVGKGKTSSSYVGFYSEIETCSYCNGSGKIPSKFIGLVEAVTPDIPFGIGSMGYSLAAGIGLALAKKKIKEPGTVIILMSDGELQCGATWESALLAAHHKLNNIRVIVDDNGLQAMGKTRDTLSVEFPRISGWAIFSEDGHDYKKIYHLLSQPNDSLPQALIFRTVKGKGVSFMEDNNDFHYRKVDEEVYEQARKELDQ